MEKEFVPYEQALALKELGFIESCYAFYNREDEPNLGFCANGFQDDTTLEIKCTAPLYQQAFRWFREKYNLDSFVKDLYKSTIKVGYYFGIDEYKGIEFQMDLDDYYKTYEEAELACLRKLIEIVKEKK